MKKLLPFLVLLGCNSGGGSAPQPLAPPAVTAPASVVAQTQPGAIPGGGRDDRRLEMRASANEIPQLPDPWDLYGQLSSKDAPSVRDAVLVCEFRLPGKARLLPWTRPDPLVKLRVADRPVQLLFGHNNRDAFAVTAPLPSLNSGDRVSAGIEDRDTFSRNDPIDSAIAVFDGGLPLELNGTVVHGSCKVLAADAVAARLADAERWVDEAKEAWSGNLRVLPAARDLGYPWAKHADLEAALDGVAALRGWTAGAMTTWRAEFRDGRADFLRRTTAAVRDLRSKAVPAGSTLDHHGHRIEVVQRLCGTPARRALEQAGLAVDVAPDCVVGLKLQRTPGAPAWSGSLQAGLGEHGLEVVLPDGRTEALKLEAAVGTGGPLNNPSLKPGETLALLYSADAFGWGRGSPLADAVLIRVGGAPPAWLALP